MASATPFVDQDEWTIDFKEILREAAALAVLVGLVVLVAFVPVAIAVFVGVMPFAFMLLAQFVLAVGSGVVLVYVVARGVQLGEG